MLALAGAAVSGSWDELSAAEQKQTLVTLFEGLSGETDAAAAISPVLRVQVMEQALMLARTKDTGGMALAQALSAGALRLLHVICQSCELWQEAPELPLYQLFGPEKDSGAVLAELRAHSAASAARALYSAGYHIGRVAHGLLCAGSASGDPDLARLFETAAVSVFTGCQLVLPDVAQLAIEAAAEMAAQAAQDIHDAQEEPGAAQDAHEPEAAHGADTAREASDGAQANP